MLKTLFSQVKQYKRVSVLTPVFTSLEVVMDVLIPYVTAKLIDLGINAATSRHSPSPTSTSSAPRASSLV